MRSFEDSIRQEMAKVEKALLLIGDEERVMEVKVVEVGQGEPKSAEHKRYKEAYRRLKQAIHANNGYRPDS